MSRRGILIAGSVLLAVVGLAILALLLSPVSVFTRPPGTPAPTRADQRLSEEVIASGLEIPWALAHAPDGRILLTDRPGRVRVIEGGKLKNEPLFTLPVAHEGEGGLLGIALDPEFERNKFIYLYYTYRSGGLANRVIRVREDRPIQTAQVLVDRIPGGTVHDGGRIRFGPDGKLYIGTGDAGASAAAQDPGSLAGKILRVNPDGSVPSDNPFPSSPVYSLGHRNVQGLAWIDDQLYTTEHGPQAHDELNRIERGANYGWPTVTGTEAAVGMVSPLIESGSSTWAPSGLAAQGGKLYFAGLRSQTLWQFDPANTELRILKEGYGRLREVVAGPKGELYLFTGNRDGRGQVREGDDRLIRLKLGG